MNQFLLKIDNLPDAKYNYSIFGFVNTSTYNKININNNKNVQLRTHKNIIINLKIDDKLNDNCIGLGMNFRMINSYSLDSTNYFELVTDLPFPLESITFNVSLQNNEQNIKEIDCTKLSEMIIKAYSNFSINKRTCIIANGIKYQIEKLEFFDESTIINENDKLNGLIINSTQINFTKTGNIKLINNNSSNNNQIFNTNFDFKELDIGGLDDELTTILRRVFISRVLPQEIINKLNVTHVKGMVLHGPPGTGKTLIARQLSKCLKAKSIKIINGPELINKYVGQSEENIRELFKEAENDMKTNTEGLHVIIFDEFDSLCVKRGDSSSVSGDINNKIVTQLLSKIDGVDSLNNILLIGMTNRLELIDPAILRPGRFEVHVEISLPDEKGRYDILQIHTKQLKKENCLDTDVDLTNIAHESKNYTGAELEGLVREARSYAINELVDLKDLNKKIDLNSIKVRKNHFTKALENYNPKFGSSNDNLDYYIQNGIIDYSDDFKLIKNLSLEYINNFKNNTKKYIGTIGIFGDTGTGKTAFSVWLSKQTEFPYIKVISNNDIAGYTESQKNIYIKEIFEQAYLSENSVIVIDSLDTILEYHRDDITGTLRFMNSLYNLIKTYVKKNPIKKNHKILIIINSELMSGIEISKYLENNFNMPLLEKDGEFLPIKVNY